jgi:hypothetical protein
MDFRERSEDELRRTPFMRGLQKTPKTKLAEVISRWLVE